MLEKSTRRQWLFACSGFVLASQGFSAESSNTAAVPLKPDPTADRFRVRMEISVAGNLEVANATSSDKKVSVPLKAEALQDYGELYFRDASGIPAGAKRTFLEARSNGTIQNKENKIVLRDEVKSLNVRTHNHRLVSYSDDFLLTSSELDLLRTPVVSLAFDRLLPSNPVRPGETWQLSHQDIATFFDLNTVEKGEVLCRLASVDDQLAKLEFTGTIEAMIDGVATKISMAAKSVFDRKLRSITWLAMSLKEKRERGKAVPGFDVTATVKILRKPIAAEEIAFKGAPLKLDEPIPSTRLVADLHGGAKFSVLADRSWRIFSDSPKLTLMRMIKQDQLIAQCEFRALSPLKAGEQLTLEAFQDDVRVALGDRFREFLDAEEQATEMGVRVLRVGVAGVVQEIPVMWSYLHFSDDTGRRLAATCSLDSKNVEAFAQADAQLAASFQFFPESKTTELPAEKSADPPTSKQANQGSPLPVR